MKPVVFMFSGQGSQYFQMGRELYQQHPRFQLWMDYCSEIVESLVEVSLIDLLYLDETAQSSAFDRILYSNPALLSIEYSLAQVLREMGIKADYLLGYSLGEFTAAVVAGAITIEEGLEISIGFAQLLEQQGVPAGMLAILERPEIMAQWPTLFNDCWLSGSNFANNFVVSGTAAAIITLQQALSDKSIASQRLPVNYGFHTPLIDIHEQQFKQLVQGLDFNPTKITTISALTGQPVLTVDENYLWNVVRQPVDFASTVQTVMANNDAIFIDVGPSGTLATFVKYLRPADSNSVHLEVINPFGKNSQTLDKLLQALATQ